MVSGRANVQYTKLSFLKKDTKIYYKATAVKILAQEQTYISRRESKGENRPICIWNSEYDNGGISSEEGKDMMAQLAIHFQQTEILFLITYEKISEMDQKI